VNPTVVLTDMGKIGWSDPVKAKGMLDKIPLGRFSGNNIAINFQLVYSSPATYLPLCHTLELQNRYNALF
jgi:hypothetical protein